MYVYCLSVCLPACLPVCLSECIIMGNQYCHNSPLSLSYNYIYIYNYNRNQNLYAFIVLLVDNNYSQFMVIVMYHLYLPVMVSFIGT